MKVFIESESKTRKLVFCGSIKELLKKLRINTSTVIVVRGEELLIEEDVVRDEDEIRILSVISGG
ncbi:MoaD/ThiS family protein [Candidatus Woesearchaeota archaeon]|nr:MoaD/ThiS family protein [Candidatus Woesearchaeota archaeon]